jgi:branched-chain amino acid transport system permease protein
MTRTNRFTSSLPRLLPIAVVFALPFVIRSPYVVSIMIFVALYAVLAIGMGVLMGKAGLFSLVGPTWFGIGAYTAGILSARGIVSPGVSIVIAAALTALIAFVIGAPVLRLKGLYLACATFGILIITQIAFVQLGDLTGGHSGLLGVPALNLFGFKLVNDRHYYFLTWALCIGCALFLSNLIDSRVGRAIIASHDSETASASLGVNIPKYRLQLFVLTAVMGSLAGSVLCFYLRFAEPGIFGFDLLVEITLMAIIGGMGSVWGPLLGGFIISWLHEILKVLLGRFFPVMTGEVTAVFFGIVIILVLIFMPRGLMGWAQQFFQLARKLYERFEARRSNS